jgi:hypothetical protein
MKTTKHYAAFLAALLLILSSCSKTDEGALPSTTQEAAFSKKSEPSSLAGRLAPTRKAKQLQITDPETGEIKIYFDCREAGTTCDVGETPAPTPGGGTRMIPINNERQLFVQKMLSSNNIPAWLYMKKNQTEAQRLFPNLFTPEIRSQLDKELYTISASEFHLAVITQNGTNNIVFVYSIADQLQTPAKIAPGGDSTLRVAKINTETGVVECKEKGGNCATLAAQNPIINPSNYLAVIDQKFRGKQLSSLVERGEYRIFANEKVIEVRPVNEKGETFYILQ